MNSTQMKNGLMKSFKKRAIWILFPLIFLACKPTEEVPDTPDQSSDDVVRALDLSSYPEIGEEGSFYKDENGNPIELLQYVKEKGINTVRVRLWVDPEDKHSGWEEVRDFAAEIKRNGLKFWLCLHYSDTWADPGHQKVPDRWSDHSFAQVKDSLVEYTERTVGTLQPDIVQVGNEVNSGFIHPYGSIQNEDQFLELLDAAATAVRSASPDSEVMIHWAGYRGAKWFYDLTSEIDYDVIGLSYYPFWHGKSLDSLSTILKDLSVTHDKEVGIVETAYPFTLGWNDWTNNIIGTEEQIHPDYAPSPEGQRDFILRLNDIMNDQPHGWGISYWGPELIAWRGAEATDGSPWENQALFDFEGRATEALSALGIVASMH